MHALSVVGQFGTLQIEEDKLPNVLKENLMEIKTRRSFFGKIAAMAAVVISARNFWLSRLLLLLVLLPLVPRLAMTGRAARAPATIRTTGSITSPEPVPMRAIPRRIFLFSNLSGGIAPRPCCSN
jgi:hypothetical protein